MWCGMCGWVLGEESVQFSRCLMTRSGHSIVRQVDHAFFPSYLPVFDEELSEVPLDS